MDDKNKVYNQSYEKENYTMLFFFSNKGLKIVKIFLYSIIIENVSCSKLFDVYFDRGQPVSKICMLGRFFSY